MKKFLRVLILFILVLVAAGVSFWLFPYNRISWSEATRLIENCQVTSATTTHRHKLYLKLKDGSSREVQNYSYDLDERIREASKKCGLNIVRGME